MIMVLVLPLFERGKRSLRRGGDPRRGGGSHPPPLFPRYPNAGGAPELAKRRGRRSVALSTRSQHEFGHPSITSSMAIGKTCETPWEW